MSESDALWLGIDVGTQGVRVVMVDGSGTVLGLADRGFAPTAGPEHHEQHPDTWWYAVVECVRYAMGSVLPSSIQALSVTSTSGTLIVCDAGLRPLRPALMWNDKRGSTEAALAGKELGNPAIRPGFSLAKAMWVLNHEPKMFNRARWLLSAGDWLLARIVGGDPMTDPTNALKLGADLDTLSWPTSLPDLGIDAKKLPQIRDAGTAIGAVGAEFAAQTGLSQNTAVILGVTDATAAQIAAGAVHLDDWVTTIGTGLSVKHVSTSRPRDPSGVLYAHRHWDGGWIVSGTSHCGGDSIAARFRDDDWGELSASWRSASTVMVLPLTTIGEYFPFRAPHAVGFEVGDPRSRGDLFRGYLEGIAYVERLAVDRMGGVESGADSPQATMGGGARNDIWMTLRASTLGRTTTRTAVATSSFGAAVVASAPSLGGISAAAKTMVRIDGAFDPDPTLTRRADQGYGRFCEELMARGYLTEVPA